MNIWNFIETKLNENKKLFLLVIIDSKGSSPGRQGFKMAVCDDNSLFGSIGGGSMEFNLVEKSRKMLSEGNFNFFTSKQVHKGDSNEGSGMICSGEQTVVFVPLDSKDKDNISLIYDCIAQNKTGILKISQKDYSFIATENVADLQFLYKEKEDGQWLFNEIIGFKSTIYIVGAGHVGFAVSKLFAQLGFKVVIIDNRPDLNMLVDNAYADEKLLVDYSKIDEYIVEGNNSYIVIMTNNHSYDKDVLSHLIRKKVKYLGMMGSKSKVAEIKKLMKEDGFTDEQLNGVYSPIGISIKSETPDEIAVSIAAEIISIKNSK